MVLQFAQKGFGGLLLEKTHAARKDLEGRGFGREQIGLAVPL